MTTRKKSTIISYFTKTVAQPLQATDNISDDERVEEEDLSQESNDLTDQTLPTKKRTNPEFDGVPIQIKKTTKVGNLLLTSVEDTDLPVVSSRARERQLPQLKTTGAETTGGFGSRIEIAMRVRDNKDKTLVTKVVDDKVTIWCNVYYRTVNANKVSSFT